jgi:hypothetical protein
MKILNLKTKRKTKRSKRQSRKDQSLYLQIFVVERSFTERGIGRFIR